MKESSIVTNIWWPKRIKNHVFLPGINLYSVVQLLLKFRQSNDITIVSIKSTASLYSKLRSVSSIFAIRMCHICSILVIALAC
jgi:hypothetical protein